MKNVLLKPTILGYLAFLIKLLLLAGCQNVQTIIEDKCIKKGFTPDTAAFNTCLHTQEQYLQQQMNEQINHVEPFLPTSPTPRVN